MAFTPTTPVTGQVISPLAAPTYTLATDTPLSIFEKQWLVSALGGTQAGVVAHTADRPFTIRSKRPSKIKNLVISAYNGIVAVYKSVPINQYDILVNTRGKIDSTGTTFGPIRCRLTIDAAAGIPANDVPQLTAALSLLLGACVQQAVGVRDNVVLGQN